MKPFLMEVPCGNCSACCQGDALRMHPEMGDDPSTYKTETIEGYLCLAHAENGDCIYLERFTGCTIYERRPAVCRELDCRVFLLKYTRKQLRVMVDENVISLRVVKAARKLKLKYGIPKSLREAIERP